MSDRASNKMRITRAVAGSIGTGLLAVLMAGVVAFGASTIRPLTATTQADQQAQATQAAAAEPTTSTAARSFGFTGGDEHAFLPEKQQPAEEPTSQPTEEPKPKPVSEPTAKPKASRAPKPASTTLALGARAKEGRIKLAWSKYTGDAFTYYKVVRSTDATVAFPLGAGDTLVTAIGDQWAPYAVDRPACGKQFHYRVFAVAHGGSGYSVLAASNVAAAGVECAPPPADPYLMGFEVFVNDAGEVKLAWEKCEAAGFKYYKAVRSAVNAMPTYPLQPGDELLAAIGDAGQTVFKDVAVASGQTWTYRVLVFADGGVLLGATPAQSVSIE